MPLSRILAALLGVASAICASAHEREIVLSQPISAPMPEYPTSMLAAGKEGVVESIVTVNVDGLVEEAFPVDAPDESFKAPTAAALRGWTFTPTTADGVPLRYSFIVPLEFSKGGVRAGPIRDEDQPDVLPKLVGKVQPIYPKELLNSHNRGRVELQIIIDKEGNVLAPRVRQATHPALEQSAIEAILKWRFSPAKAKGKPIFIRVSQGVRFDMDEGRSVDAYKVGKARKNKMPEALQVDVNPKPRITVFAVHPYDDAVARKGGSAEVKCVVGPDGNVVATEVLSASKPEFGFALVAAMEAWTFEPARYEEKRVPITLSRKVKFEIGARDSAIDPDASAIASRIRKGRFAPAKANELDVPLKPKFTIPPVYPTALKRKGVDGTASIEVIVDKKGRAVLPRIIEASEPEFGWAAATAVQRWRFDPPKVKGKPVEVRVVIPVKFTPLEAAASGMENRP